MKFQNNDHKMRYEETIARMKKKDCYHKSAAYLIGLANLVPDDVFDFAEDVVKYEGIYKGWQTHSSKKATRLMLNLWNGTFFDNAADCPEDTAGYYAVDEIFSNREYAPYFWIAVLIRFEWI